MARLLYFVHIPRFFVTHRLAWALAAQEAGYDVHITTGGDDPENIARIKDAGLPFHPIPLSQHSLNPFKELQSAVAIAGVFRRLQPDIVHLVSAKPIFYGGVVARLMRLPRIVSSVSGLGYTFADHARFDALQIIQKVIYKAALDYHRCHIIFQNEDDMGRFRRLLAQDPSHLHLIRGAGVEMSRFIVHPEADGLPVVLFAGRLIWKKGLGEFMEAARRLRGRARFWVAGYVSATHPNKVPQETLQQAHEEGIIEFLGKRDDMPEVFAQSHIVCLPTAYGEGVPKVLIEAAACGRPIITTDKPGCRDVVHHEENGLLIPPYDVDSLVDALETLIENPQLRQEMGARGRGIVEDEFSMQHVMQALFALYDHLLETF